VIANEEYWPKLRDASRDAGQSASPDDLFLAMRGMRTLDARLKRHEASTIEIARKLQAHPKVKARSLSGARERSGACDLEARLPWRFGALRRGARRLRA
jgi:cystathionine beta-lyase/cystathionine gamma-synthase